MIKLQLTDHTPHCGAALIHHIVNASINSPSPINFEAHCLVKTDHAGKFIQIRSFDLSKIETTWGSLEPDQFDAFLNSINTSIEEVEESMSSAFIKNMNWDLPSNQSSRMKPILPNDEELEEFEKFIESMFGGVKTDVKNPFENSRGEEIINSFLNILKGK